MIKIKKIASMAIAAALTGAILTGCGNTDTSEPSKTKANDGKDLQVLRVAVMTGEPDQYATYIGIQQGIFEKYGISVETIEYVAGVNTIDSVVNGTADTGLLADFAAVNRIGNTLHDTNLEIFSELSVSVPNNGGLYVSPEFADDLSKLDGSKGFITTLGTVTEYYNWQAQTYAGIDPEKQNIVQTDSNQTSLALAKNNDASAIVAYGSNGKYFEDQGWVLAANSEDIGISIATYLLTTKEFLDKNNDLIANYLKALDESVTYITEHLDEVSSDVESKFGINSEDFKQNWEARIFRIGLSKEGAKQLDDLNAWAYSQGKYEEEYNIRDFINTSAIEKALPDNITIKK